MKHATAALISLAAGFLVWSLSPWLTGAPLPWDAPWPFYSLVMVLGGLVVSLLSSRGWLCVGAAWAGQVAALMALPLDRTVNMMGVGAWWVLGVVATGLGALLLGVGWVAGRYARSWMDRSGRPI